MLKTPETGKVLRKRVLLVEDHKYNLLVLKMMLERMGLSVIPALNGKEAVEICMAKADDLDLILMDIKMPVMDGYTAMLEIKRRYPHMRIVAETAYALAGDDEKILAAGFDDYLAKPITPERLELIIRRNLP